MRFGGSSVAAVVAALVVAVVAVVAGCNTRSSSTSSAGATGTTTATTATTGEGTTGTTAATAATAAATDTAPVVGGCVRRHVDCAALAPSPEFHAGEGPKNASFPAPPPGSGLCGTEGMAMSYYLSTTTAVDLFTYYKAKLTAAGYTVKPPRRGGAPCDIQMEFEKGPKFGNVYFFGEREAFSVAVPLD